MRALPICLLALMLSGCSMLSRSPVEPVQASNQDSPPNIPTARKRMQINASKMKANAVLLHSCEVTSGTPGCYRQAVCIGSALNISAK